MDTRQCGWLETKRRFEFRNKLLAPTHDRLATHKLQQRKSKLQRHRARRGAYTRSGNATSDGTKDAGHLVPSDRASATVHTFCYQHQI